LDFFDLDFFDLDFFALDFFDLERKNEGISVSTSELSI
jgi:hypothetical protein